MPKKFFQLKSYQNTVGFLENKNFDKKNLHPLTFSGILKVV